MVVGTRRIERCFGFHQLFGFTLQTVERHGRLRGSAHHHLLRQDLVALAEQHVQAVDDFFLSGIVPFGLVTHAARKHGNFGHHAFLQQGRGIQFRPKGINTFTERLVVGLELMHGGIEIAEDSNLHVRTDIPHLFGADNRNLRAPDKRKRNRDNS